MGTVNGTFNSHFPGFPSDSFIPSPTAARMFAAGRVAQGVDYIKVTSNPLGLTMRLLPRPWKPPMKLASWQSRTLHPMPIVARWKQHALIFHIMGHWTHPSARPLVPN
jgi:hypothetical protein